MSERTAPLLWAVTQVVSAHVANASVEPREIAPIISAVAASFASLGDGAPEAATGETRLTAAKIRKSITPDALISFEDGRPYKILKRHLAALGLTPDDYRAKWGLPYDYPMVAPNQSAARSQIARQVGFWRKDGHGSRAKTL